MQTDTPRRGGIKLDFERLDFELGRRGIDIRSLAERAGCSELALSRARHGHSDLRGTTFRKISEALLTFPIVKGGDLLLMAPPAHARTAEETA